MYETVGMIAICLAVICIVLCAHYLQQVRDELRELNKRLANRSAGHSSFSR